MNRFKQLEEENPRLKKLVAELSLNKEMLPGVPACKTGWRHAIPPRWPVHERSVCALKLT